MLFSEMFKIMVRKDNLLSKVLGGRSPQSSPLDPAQHAGYVQCSLGPNLLHACAEGPHAYSRPGVPSLGDMNPETHICFSKGVHLRLAVENKIVFMYYLFSNIYVSEYYFQISLNACC